MFSGYRIGSYNDEEVLYIYVADVYEFSNGNNKKKSFIDRIIDYININKINFNGKKIVIVVNGLILGTFILAASFGSINSSVNNDKTIYVDKVYLNTYNEKNEIEDITIVKKDDEDKKIVINEESSSSQNNEGNNSIINENKTDKNTTNNKTENDVVKVTPKSEESNNNSSIETHDENITDSNSNQGPSSDTNTSTPTNQNETTTNIPEQATEPIQNKTMVTIYRSNGVVENIELEEYIIGVVGAEMPASFNIEALKVQAIIARTYALRALEKNITLTDTVSTQVYKDNNQLKTMWGNSYETYYNKIKSAVLSTTGLKIIYNNQLIEALYFSCSNGYTEDSYNVWGNFVPYLKSIKNDYDTSSSAYYRETTFSYSDLSRLLGLNIDDASSFSINSKNESNRVTSVSISYMNYTGIELRGKLSLRSTDFDIERVDGGLKFITRGYGHGVGLSQYGANGMANNGYSYFEIINYYYQGVSIVK